MKEIYKGGYIIQPYAFNRLTVKGRPITKAETVVLSAIYSMSVKGGKARYSYRTLSQKFRLAKSTVARCVGNLCEEGLISQDKSNRTAAEYMYVGPEVKKGALRGDAYLFSEKFTYKKGDLREDVTLTKAEIRILNKIMSVDSLETSERQLARMLNLSDRVVRSALDTLLHTDLIFRPEKGDCSTRKSVLKANAKKLRALEVKYKRTKEEVGYEVVFVPKAVKDANERAERESYYARKKQEMQDRIERIDSLCRDNATYRMAQEAYFDALHRCDWAEMERQDAVMGRIKEKIAAKFPVKVECDECNDTGELPDGTYCTCWKKGKKRR